MFWHGLNDHKIILISVIVLSFICSDHRSKRLFALSNNAQKIILILVIQLVYDSDTPSKPNKEQKSYSKNK